MNFETIRNKKKILLIGIILFCIGVTLILATSLANYKKAHSFPVASGDVKYIVPDVLINIYKENDNGDYESVTTIPKNYFFNKSESFCTINNIKLENIKIDFNVINSTFSFSPLNERGTKCYLYFDKGTSILADNNIQQQLTKIELTSCSSGCGESTVGMFKEVTNLGTTYYYRGDVINNYVEFAGQKWRIIRINENGSIRIISENSIKEIVFDMDMDFIGFTYQKDNSLTKSVILTELEKWYEDKIIDNDLTSYIDIESGFCVDSTYTTGEWKYYGAYIRLGHLQRPTYNCNKNDLYTIDSSTKGNNLLKYPIGLISADEVVFAGGIADSRYPNTKYYLASSNSYWTLSPSRYSRDQGAQNFIVYTDGTLRSSGVKGAKSLRPVINLNSNIVFLGDGTYSNPYKIAF